MLSQEEFEFLFDCGYSKALASCNLSDRPEMLECVIVHFTHYRVRAELDQLKEGLAKVGILRAIQTNPFLFKPLLCPDIRLEVTSQYIRDLFVPSLSEVGSNARRLEEDILYNWEEYLKEIGNGISL